MKTQSWRLNIDDERNNTVRLVDSTVVTVENIVKTHKELYIVGKEYINARELFTTPGFESRRLGIEIVPDQNVTKTWHCKFISCKIFKIACTNGYITYSIIHTFVNNK